MKNIRSLISKYNMAHRVTIIYMIFGILWILLSDKFLSFVITDIEVMAFIQTIKGNLYVVITGLLLWVLIVRGLREINVLHDETAVSEAKYRSYFEQGFIGIILFDETMKVVDANVKAQQIFGMSKQGILAMDMDMLMTQESGEIVRALQSGDKLGEVTECTIKSQNGSITHTLISFSRIDDEYGVLKNYAAFIQEINELKKYQDALVALNNQLEQRVLERTAALDKSNSALKKALGEQETMSTQLERSNQSLRVTVEHLNQMQNRLVQTERMTTLGNLVASLTHEVSTPVGAAMTAGSFIEEKTKDIYNSFEIGKLTKSEFHQYVTNLNESTSIINRNLNHAAELMTNFKQMAADQTQMEVRCANIGELVDEILLSMKPVLKGKKIEYDLDIDPQLVSAVVPGYITQILNNLLTNAYKHGLSEKDEGVIKIHIKENAGRLQILFEDNGKGIDDEHREEIYKPFYSTLNRETRDGLSGIGLGLYIVKQIVEENLQGTIEMETEVGLYTRFIIEFDLKDCG